MKPARLKTQPDRPWQMPRIEDADIFALQAVANGIANAAQQQRAYAYIVCTLCETDRMTFWPGGEDGKRATDFAEGKRWVGLQLRRIEKMRPDRGNESIEIA
jgi:phage tail sheath protein FI